MSAGDFALLLLLSGIMLLYAEFNRPGTILLGAAGALLFMLGVARLLPLHLSVVCTAVCLLGIGSIVLGLHFPWRSWAGFGALAGMLALIFGLRDLVQGPGSIHPFAAIAAGTIFAVVTSFLGKIAVLAARNKRRPPARVLRPYSASSREKPQHTR